MMQYPGKEWARVTPEMAGIPSAAIENALLAIEQSGKDIHSLLIVRDGQLAFEHYFAPYDATKQHSMFSCSKTFTSMLIGIAQGKGLLSIRDSVMGYFGDVPVSNPNEYLMQMTIRDLLMMGSGHSADTFPGMLSAEDGDWPRVFLNLPVEHKPGTHFVYNTGATYMLSNILTRVTGQTALQLAEEWIFKKIGIECATWETDPKGYSRGGTGLHIRPLDMARFGHLLACEGCWKGEQIIPAEYIREASTKQIDNRDPMNPNQNPNWAAGYCYQMWRCAFPAFRADGMGGQYIVMCPGGFVFIFTSALGDDIGYPLDVLKEHLLPALVPSSLAEDTEAYDRLMRLSARLNAPEALNAPDAAACFPYDKTIRIVEEASPISHVIVGRDAITVRIGGNDIRLKYGYGRPEVTHVRMPQAIPALRLRAESNLSIAIRAEWTDGLHLRVQFVGEPLTLYCAAKVEGKLVRISVRTTIAGSHTLEGVMDA